MYSNGQKQHSPETTLHPGTELYDDNNNNNVIFANRQVHCIKYLRIHKTIGGEMLLYCGAKVN